MMLITVGVHLYEKCTKNVFHICLVYFQNCAAIKKKVTMVSKHTLVQISLDPWLNGKYMLPNKKGGQLFCPPSPQFLKVGRAIAPALSPMKWY